MGGLSRFSGCSREVIVSDRFKAHLGKEEYSDLVCLHVGGLRSLLSNSGKDRRAYLVKPHWPTIEYCLSLRILHLFVR